jgi:cytochrome c oxidase assembly protein subunit 15
VLRGPITPGAYRRLTLAAAVALVAIILTGGGVRLTGSGLGCSDWPTCEEGQLVAPLEYHAMIEFVNRLITGIVSIAVALAVLGSVRRVPRRRDLTVLSWGLVLGVFAQILIGALVVKTHLVPAAVSAHFLVSMVLVANALVLHWRAGAEPGPRSLLVPTSVLRLVQARLVVACAVLLIGTFVTGAGPHSGDPGEVDRLDLSISAITRVHSLAAWLLLLTSVAVAARIATLPLAPAVRAGLVRREQVVVALLLAQGAVGYVQYAQGVPAGLVALHLLGAACAFSAILWAHLGLRSPGAEPVVEPREIAVGG